MARGRPAASADVWEESEGGDGREGVEVVAADRHQRGLLLLLLLLLLLSVVVLVDVENDVVRSLGRDRWNDEMAIVEEGKDGIVITAYSNWLCDSASRFVCSREKKVWGVVHVPFSLG